MLFFKMENDVATEWPLTEKELRGQLHKYTLPAHLSNDLLNPLGYGVLEPLDWATIPKPDMNNLCVLTGVSKGIDGRWHRVYSLTPVSGEMKNLRVEGKWREVRAKRDALLDAFDWRIKRYERQVRMGDTPVDSLEVLDMYMKALSDITLQIDPFLVEFPAEP